MKLEKEGGEAKDREAGKGGDEGQKTPDGEGVRKGGVGKGDRGGDKNVGETRDRKGSEEVWRGACLGGKINRAQERIVKFEEENTKLTNAISRWRKNKRQRN